MIAQCKDIKGKFALGKVYKAYITPFEAVVIYVFSDKMLSLKTLPW